LFEYITNVAIYYLVELKLLFNNDFMASVPSRVNCREPIPANGLVINGSLDGTKRSEE
jgi:hypothetical protein